MHTNTVKTRLRKKDGFDVWVKERIKDNRKTSIKNYIIGNG